MFHLNETNIDLQFVQISFDAMNISDIYNFLLELVVTVSCGGNILVNVGPDKT